jgi:site-specific DNA-methyltransferase (adenine-specific)
MKEIPDKSVDMILCDLPYGTTACKWDNVIPFEPLWEQYKRIIKDNGTIALFGSEPFSSKLRLSNLKMYRYDWVWIKDKGSDPLNANKRPLNNIENIMIFFNKMGIYNPQMKVAKPYIKNQKNSRLGEHLKDKKIKPSNKINYGFRYPLRNIYFARDTSKGYSLHIVQKPIALLEYLIKTYTNEGNTVLDNCMGSGSTGVACINTNRNFIGIELDENYFNIAKERINGAINDGN